MHYVTMGDDHILGLCCAHGLLAADTFQDLLAASRSLFVRFPRQQLTKGKANPRSRAVMNFSTGPSSEAVMEMFC